MTVTNRTCSPDSSRTSPVTKAIFSLAIGTSAVLLTGCTNMLTPIGENTYDCNRKENPASPYCHSFKSVESSTSGAIPQSRYDETMRLSDLDRMTGIAPVPRLDAAGPPGRDSSAAGERMSVASPGTSAAGVPVAPVAPVAPLAPAPSLEGLPVREGPVVQRVWVKRFVDGNDLLVGETVIYKEIIGSHWQGFGRFDSTTGANAKSNAPPTAKDGVRYPHRPPQPPAQKAFGSVSSPVDLGNGGRSSASPTPTSPGFTQPGAPAPERGEMAPVPATSSGTTSMPE